MNVVRLCSVYEPPHGAHLDRPEWDPIGGMQFHTGQLTASLDQLGVWQTVVTAYVPGGPRFERQSERVEVHRVGWPVPVCRQLYAAPAAVVLARVAHRHDLIHVHLGEDLAVLPLALMAARFAEMPLILTIHCSLRHTLAATDARSAVLHHVGGRLERMAIARAATTITLTEKLRQRLLDEGRDPRSVVVIPSGVNLTLFDGDMSDPLPSIAHPRIVYVGRLTEHKGLRTLLGALPLVDDAAEAVIVGDGPMRQELETLARATGRHVHFTGFVPHAAVPAVLRCADVVVLPSVYEELGSVLVEAMAAGAPIVASRVGGIPEALGDGRAGLLVPPEQPEALARAIDDVLSDTALATCLGAEGRRRALDYSWTSLARHTYDLYERAVSHRM